MTRTLLLLAAMASATPLSAGCPSMQWAVQHQYGNALYNVQTPLIIDYDEDGVLDLITNEEDNKDPANPSEWGTLFARRGLGGGAFGSPVQVVPVKAGPQAADVDGDGHLDLIVVTRLGKINVLPGTGTWFGPPIASTNNDSLTAVMAGNFDADPATELVATHETGFVLYDNVGGAFVETQRVSLFRPTGVAVADFDDDGNEDVVVGHRGGSTVLVYFRNADGSFPAPLSIPAGGWPKRVVTGDVDGDGATDFAFSHWYTGEIRVYRNFGLRQFTQTTIQTKPGNWKWLNADYRGDELALSDLDGDGDLDLISSGWNGRHVTTLMGVGDGTFLTPSQTPAFFSTLSSVAVADLDGDGKKDVVGGSTRRIAVFTSTCETFVDAYVRSRMISVGQPARINIDVAGFGTTTPTDRGSASVEGVSADVDANGHAILEVHGLQAGSYVFHPTFNGNETVPPGTSAGVVVNVTTMTTRTTLSLSSGWPPVYGFDWNVRVRIETSTGEDLSDAVPYTLVVDGVETQTVAWARLLSPGPHTIRARYEGGYDYPPSESEPLSVTVLQATPVVEHLGPLTARAGTAVVLQTKVSSSLHSNSEKPTGTMQYLRGSTLLASAPLVNGVASATLPVLQRGSHDLHYVYSGDTNYESTTATFTFQVLPNEPLAIEARGLPTGIHIAAVLPPNYSRLDLFRRTAGTTEWQASSWSWQSGMDPMGPSRGVVYEYQLRVWLTNGSEMLSSIDSAMLFTDDLLAIGTAFKRVHFVELRQAVNQQRTLAGLPPFEFDASFASSPIVRASHINGLRTALNQARSTLGMAPATFPTAIAGTTKILASDVQQLREHAR